MKGEKDSVVIREAGDVEGGGGKRGIGSLVGVVDGKVVNGGGRWL